MSLEGVLVLVPIFLILGIAIYRGRRKSNPHSGDRIASESNTAACSEVQHSKEATGVTDTDKALSGVDNPVRSKDANHSINKSGVEQHDLGEDRSGNKQLMMDSLLRLGCQVEILAPNYLRFLYQGESFTATFSESMVRIWDTAFYAIKQDDVRVIRILDLINRLNLNMGPNLYMREPDENGDRFIESKWDIVFRTELPNIEEYLVAVLQSFFHLQRNFRIEVEKIMGGENDSVNQSLSSIKPSQN